MAASGTASSDDPTGKPLVRVGRRFLPVAAATLPPLPVGGVVSLPVPAGTPVHAVGQGRVLAAEGSAVGEVVLRLDDEVRLAYRRLAPSSVLVRQGQTVAAGDHLGVVARDAGDDVATLEMSATRADGSPVDLAELIVGAADPLELFLAPPKPPDMPTRSRVASRPPPASGPPAARLTRRRPRSGPPPTGPEPDPPAPEPARKPEQPVEPASTAAAEDTTEAGSRARRLAGRRRRPERRS